MFDFTKEISLDKKNYSLYRKLRLALYLAAIFSAAYFAYLVLFPHNTFNFSFLEPNSIENNIVTPQIEGNMPNMTFSNVVLDYYSHITITLDIPQKIDETSLITASVRKSYQAFFYPEAEPIGFRDGTLLKNGEKYYIVSGGSLRLFANLNTAIGMGFSENYFEEASEEELEYNPLGAILNAGDPYPDAAIFLIDGNHYMLENQKLWRFSSLNAFRSRYDEKIAIEKNENFFDQFPVSEELIGFSDGALVSNGDSALIVSAGLIYPIDNAQTFLSNGYQWENILPATSAEVSLYERTRLFNIKNPHPDGTIFKTMEDSRYYIIKNGKKHHLPSEHVAASWKNSPILTTKSLETKESCELKKKTFWGNSYSCAIPLEKFSQLSGNEYEITLSSDAEFSVNYITADYRKNTDAKNLKIAINSIIYKIKVNYGLAAATE